MLLSLGQLLNYGIASFALTAPVAAESEWSNIEPLPRIKFLSQTLNVVLKRKRIVCKLNMTNLQLLTIVSKKLVPNIEEH